MFIAIFFGAFVSVMTESTVSYEECLKMGLQGNVCKVEKVLHEVCLKSGRKPEECER